MTNERFPELKRLSRNILYLRKTHRYSIRKMAKILKKIHIITLICIDHGIYPKEADIGILLRLYMYFGIMPSVLLGQELDSGG